MAIHGVRGHVSLRLLGGLALQQNGVALTGFRSRKALLLLAYLAVRRTPQTRTWLTELFWPTMSPTPGRAELARVLNDIKTRVGPVLVADRQRVGLVAGAIVNDFAALETAADGGDLTEAAVAVAAYSGPLLAGTEVLEPELAQWVDEQRRSTEVLVGELLERLCRNADDDEAALIWARRWVAHTPTDEEANRAMIRMLTLTGRPAAALAHYAGLEERLADELGVAPEPRTVALARAARRAQGEAVVPVPELPPLPLSWTPLLGREELVEEVTGRLGPDHTRLVTLTGTGGVGKTRVALEAAQRHRESGAFDAVGFVDLSAVRLVDLVDDAVRRQLGLVAGPDLRLALRRQLDRGRILLVLDNLEQIGGIAEYVLRLLTELPRLVVLATSRGALRLVGEQPVEVTPLGLDDAVALFRQQAEVVGATRRLLQADENGMGARAICAQLGGLPLAVELAAIGLQTLDLEQLSRRLAPDPDEVEAQERNRPIRHRTVRDAIGWSVDLLAPDHQRAFAWSSAFVAAVRPVRLAEVTAVPEPQAAAALHAMRAVGLTRWVRPPRDPDGSRGTEPRQPGLRRAPVFASLPLVRAVATHTLRSSGAEPTAHRRHADIYLRLAQGAARRGQDVDGSDQIDRLLELEAEVDEVRVALERAADRSVAELARWCVELRVFWQLCGHLAEALGWAERVLAAPDEIDPVTHGWVLVLAEWATIRTGDLARSHELHELLQPLVRTRPDHELAVYSASTGAGYALHSGRVEESMRLAEEVGALADQRGVIEVQLNQRAVLGFVAEMLGQGGRAAAVAREGVALSVRHSDIQWRPSLQSVLARRLLIEGDPAQAAAVYADALQQIARTGDTYMLQACLIGAAEAAAALERDRESAQLVAAMVALDEAVGAINGVYTAARDRLSAELPGRLGPATYEEAAAAGRRLTSGEAARLVREVSVSVPQPVGQDEAAAR